MFRRTMSLFQQDFLGLSGELLLEDVSREVSIELATDQYAVRMKEL